MEFEEFFDKVYYGIRESVLEFQKEEIKDYYKALAINFKKKSLDDEDAIDMSRLLLEIKEYVKNPELTKHDVLMYLDSMQKNKRIMFFNECFDYPYSLDHGKTYFTFSVTPKNTIMNYFINTLVKKG